MLRAQAVAGGKQIQVRQSLLAALPTSDSCTSETGLQRSCDLNGLKLCMFRGVLHNCCLSFYTGEDLYWTRLASWEELQMHAILG
mmetsp:Transcript_84429/g.225584  ORF Transcript_84429/g.225584 Transcript_84429/m.225584 type:complete len:85 (+) Transcript_84429:1510-1764(+)